MTFEEDFWKHKNLSELSQEEWEALCDGCGLCCLYKIEDDDTGEIFLTNVACRFLDIHHGGCQLYQNRKKAMPDCVQLTLANISRLSWLPATCAYRLLLEGKTLPDWHPLVSGSSDSVHRAGIAAAGKVVSETSIRMQDLEEYIVDCLTPLDERKKKIPAS